METDDAFQQGIPIDEKTIDDQAQIADHLLIAFIINYYKPSIVTEIEGHFRLGEKEVEMNKDFIEIMNRMMKPVCREVFEEFVAHGMYVLQYEEIKEHENEEEEDARTKTIISSLDTEEQATKEMKEKQLRSDLYYMVEKTTKVKINTARRFTIRVLPMTQLTVKVHRRIGHMDSFSVYPRGKSSVHGNPIPNVKVFSHDTKFRAIRGSREVSKVLVPMSGVQKVRDLIVTLENLRLHYMYSAMSMSIPSYVVETKVSEKVADDTRQHLETQRPNDRTPIVDEYFSRMGRAEEEKHKWEEALKSRQTYDAYVNEQIANISETMPGGSFISSLKRKQYIDFQPPWMINPGVHLPPNQVLHSLPNSSVPSNYNDAESSIVSQVASAFNLNSSVIFANYGHSSAPQIAAVTKQMTKQYVKRIHRNMEEMIKVSFFMTYGGDSKELFINILSELEDLSPGSTLSGEDIRYFFDTSSVNFHLRYIPKLEFEELHNLWLNKIIDDEHYQELALDLYDLPPNQSVKPVLEEKMSMMQPEGNKRRRTEQGDENAEKRTKEVKEYEKESKKASEEGKKQ